MARNLKNIARLIETVNDTKPVEELFLSDLKRSIELTAKKNSRLPSQTYKPSGMNCIRAMYYQVMGKECVDEPNYTNVGICASGSDIHERIQQAVIDMKANGMDCEYINVAEYVKSRDLSDIEIVQEPDFEKGQYETKLYNKKYNMSFLCDGIIRYKDHYYILELKTEASFKWQSRSGVDPKHYKQGIAYSLNLGLDEVIFVYINRDVLDMKSFMFNVDDKMRQSLIDLVTECQGYVDRQIAPPKPSDLGKYACKYCGYAGICSNDK
jgi:CRISPR/Cas system-associated exonuclease Cas4 (RecB family)